MKCIVLVVTVALCFTPVAEVEYIRLAADAVAVVSVGRQRYDWVRSDRLDWGGHARGERLLC